MSGGLMKPWLPIVDHCCWCVPNLRTATIIIASIALVAGIDSVNNSAFKSYCMRFKDSRLGRFVMFWYGIHYLILWAYTITSAILLYTTIKKRPNVIKFVYAQLALIVSNVSLAALHVWRYYVMDPKMRCFKLAKSGYETGWFDVINYAFWALVGACSKKHNWTNMLDFQLVFDTSTCDWPLVFYMNNFKYGTKSEIKETNSCSRY